MDRGAAVVLTALVGGCIALQAPINSHLGRSVGTFQAAFLSFAIGTVLLAVIAALASGGMGQIGEARHLPWYYLTGGVLGAAYVTTVLVTVRTLGGHRRYRQDDVLALHRWMQRKTATTAA